MCEMVDKTNKLGKYSLEEEQMVANKAKKIVECFLRSEISSPVLVSPQSAQ